VSTRALLVAQRVPRPGGGIKPFGPQLPTHRAGDDFHLSPLPAVLPLSFSRMLHNPPQSPPTSLITPMLEA
jgi:hypothetical protein